VPASQQRQRASLLIFQGCCCCGLGFRLHRCLQSREGFWSCNAAVGRFGGSCRRHGRSGRSGAEQGKQENRTPGPSKRIATKRMAREKAE
jgi:hypothetical protein